MTQQQLNEHINKKYPHIEYKEGEDLNLNNIYTNAIAEVWSDKKNYPSVKHICKKVNLSERQVYRLAQKIGLESRVYYKNK